MCGDGRVRVGISSWAEEVRGTKTMMLETSMPADTTAVSVSYTHLRAHETRGNLVCRLLLEKKKYNT